MSPRVGRSGDRQRARYPAERTSWLLRNWAVFDFVINVKTAQALRLAIPQSVLLQATEIIQ